MLRGNCALHCLEKEARCKRPWILTAMDASIPRRKRLGIFHSGTTRGSEENFWLPLYIYVWSKQPEKPSQPCRLVFQANQKTDSGLSLNDHLHKGQDILSNLVTMVIRFRSFKYAFNLDIHRMFHHFALNPRDQDFLRFFAVIKRDGKITHESWRAAYLPFGLNCSPYVACFLLQQHAKQYLDHPKLKSGASQICRHSYMDESKY